MKTKMLEGTVTSISYTPKRLNFASLYNVNIQFEKIAETFVFLKPQNNFTIGQRLRINYDPESMAKNHYFVLNYAILPLHNMFASLNPDPLPPRDLIDAELAELESHCF